MNRWRAIGMAGLVLTAAAPAAAQFTPGDVFHGGSAGEIHNITGGGDFALVTPFADTGQYSASQFVWSLDLETMYVGHVQVGTVSAIDSSGTVTTFAEGIDGPTGLVMTRDGRLLVAAFNQGEIYDITAGGTLPPEQPPLVTGLNGPRSMVELADGRILVADQFANAVYDIGYPDGGAVGAPFADGHDSPRALAVAPDGTIYVNSDASGGSVYDITTGGAPAVTPFAIGKSFFGITVLADGTLLASAIIDSEVWDITGGGDFTNASGWAIGLPLGETQLDVVPAAYCGSGVQAATEECDDGNDSNEDDCLNDCTLAVCGDGFVLDGGEACDDGNTDDGDGCASDCTLEDDGGGEESDGGCGCRASTSGGLPSGLLLLGLTVLGLRRRRRR